MNTIANLVNSTSVNSTSVNSKKCHSKNTNLLVRPHSVSSQNCIENINFTEDIEMENLGRELYKTNDFYKSLANLMSNNDFKTILKNFWNNELEIKSFVMYIQLYQYINNRFPDLSEYKKIHMIKMLIDNKNTRGIICKDFLNEFSSSSPNKNNLLY